MYEILQGKRAAILGVANEDSIAWHIAKTLKQQGASIYLGYQQRFKSRVLQLFNNTSIQPDGLFRCDVLDQKEVEGFFQQVGAPLDILIHSIAFAPMETFAKPVYELLPEEFTKTLEVSSYSFLRLAKIALPYLSENASLLAMTYLGAQRVIPGYRIMGIAKAALESVVRELAFALGPKGVRVNAISAGPIRTLAAQAVPDFDLMLEHYAKIAPLRTTVDASDVGELAVFLSSDFSKRITGQVIFVDAGFSILAAAK